MEMSPVFPFCVPVAAGIVFVFMGNPLKSRYPIVTYNRGFCRAKKMINFLVFKKTDFTFSPRNNPDNLLSCQWIHDPDQ